MQLSQDIIYYRLNLKYRLRFDKRNDAMVRLMRPIFFESGECISGCCVIIGAEDLKCLVAADISYDDTLFICTDNFEKGSIKLKGSVIVVESYVPPVHLFNDLQKIYNLFDNWDEVLKIIAESGSFSELIDSCDMVLYDPISLMDDMFHYIGYSKALSRERGLLDTSVNESNSLPADFISYIVSDKAFLKLREATGVFIKPPLGDALGDVLSKNIFYNGKYVGQLGIKLSGSDEQLIRYDTAILEHLYGYIHKLYCKYTSFNQKDIYLGGLRNLIINCLEKQEISEAQWLSVFRENGWNRADRLQLVQFKPNPRYDKNMYAKYFSIEIEKKWHGCACLEHKGHLLILVNLDRFKSDSSASFNQALAYFLRDNLLVAGLSRIFSSMSYLLAALEQTKTALAFGDRLTPTRWYYRFDDYALDFMLSSCTGPYRAEEICSEKLLILRDYDNKKNTEYLKTLQTFLECRFNVAEAAKKLFIQRTSLHKRINRMRKLAGIDFDSNDEMLYLANSLKLLQKTE